MQGGRTCQRDGLCTQVRMSPSLRRPTHLAGTLHGVTDEGWLPAGAVWRGHKGGCKMTREVVSVLGEHELCSPFFPPTSWRTPLRLHSQETRDTVSGHDLSPSVHVARVEGLVDLSSALDEIERGDWWEIDEWAGRREKERWTWRTHGWSTSSVRRVRVQNTIERYPVLRQPPHTRLFDSPRVWVRPQAAIPPRAQV